MVDLKFTPSRAALSLLAGFALLLVAYVSVAALRAQTGDMDLLGFAPLFDMDREGNFPSWFNSILFAIAAFVSWIAGNYARAHDRRQRLHWFVIASVMIALSVDELVALHELLGSFKALKDQFYFSWIVILAPAAGLLGLWFIPFLLRLPLRIGVVLAASGAAYLAGAVGLEIIGGKIVEGIVHAPLAELTPEQWTSIITNKAYLTEVALEESFEQCGLILYIYGVLGYLARAGAVMTASFGLARD